MAEATTNTTTIIARADQHDIDLHKASDRVNFGSIREPIDVPYLLGVQTDSFDWLIGNERWQKRVQEDLENGTNTVPHTSGLDEVFQEISPIENFAQTMSLTFSDPYFEEPRHTVQECKEKDYTYSAPLYVNAEFENGDTGEIKSQTVFMGDFPLQTPHGTFIIGGTERVIVSQLVRSPGVYFDRSQDRTSDKEVFGAKIIPSRGAWLEFEIDKRDVLGVRVDRKRKQSAIVFLMAIGMTKDEIADAFKDYPLVMDALAKETVQTQDEALTDLYRKIRPADTPTPEAGKNLLDSFYFNTKRYDLARVGRYKINRKLGLEKDVNDRSLSREDIIATIKYLVTLHAGDTKFPGKRDGKDVDLRVDVDDIDHFGNRRIRQVGELIQNQLRTGLSRMERVVRERMTTQDPEAITPQSLINIRPVNATIKEFFGTSQLSQFMDQNNPLAGVTNKRRLSALGPGGLSRDRASMEVRDVHPSHFGRMCPIESPEGPNIGLIGSLATFGRINPFGFIETPYRKVVNGHVTDEVEYMTADRDAEHVIAQANQELDENGNFVKKQALARVGEEEAVDVPVSSVDYMDVSPRQMVSVGASLIPFLEHDEGHRALMGTNMQRQAVPLDRIRASARGHRRRMARRRRFRRRHPGREAGRGDLRVRRHHPYHERRWHHQLLQAGQVPALQPDHLLQPGPAHPRRRTRGSRHRAGRWSGNPEGRDGTGQEPAHRLHAVERLQLRGCCDHLPAPRAGRHPELHPHRGVRDRRPRNQAGCREDRPATCRTSARTRWPTSTSVASSASAPKSKPATFWSARSPRRARPS